MGKGLLSSFLLLGTVRAQSRASILPFLWYPVYSMCARRAVYGLANLHLLVKPTRARDASEPLCPNLAAKGLVYPAVQPLLEFYPVSSILSLGVQLSSPLLRLQKSFKALADLLDP